MYIVVLLWNVARHNQFYFSFSPLQHMFLLHSVIFLSYLIFSSGHVIQYSCKKKLTNDQWKEVYKALALRSIKGKISQQIARETAASFSVSPRTVSHIWRCTSQCFKQGENIDVTKKRYNCGRKDALVDLSSCKVSLFLRGQHRMICHDICMLAKPNFISYVVTS